MKLTAAQLKTYVIVAANKMVLPFGKYMDKKVKSKKLDQEDVLHLTLNAQINVFVKVMFDLRAYMRRDGKNIDLDSMVQFVCDESKKHFQKMDVSKPQPTPQP